MTDTLDTSRRLRVMIRGAVQGVGFRPFVYRLAAEIQLKGWVNNTPEGVVIEVEGPPAALDSLLLRLRTECPPAAVIRSVETSSLRPAGYSGFEIRESESAGPKIAAILPDLATCAECVNEIFDPANRRYRYPFANCTHCGPRFSILLDIPYDRPNTTMRAFTMCGDCRAEYDNPLDRRFHAQPIACPACGPQIEIWDKDGRTIAARDAALFAAASAIREGQIVALKGLGGFQLIVDARNSAAVRTLRLRKHREEKPFAVLYPSLESIKADCEISPEEERLLLSPQAPILLVERRREEQAAEVSWGSPETGVMLPYTPLHHLLMAELGFPVVATSGNLSDEPICTDEDVAVELLGAIADVLLVNNRPIARPIDDSVARVVLGQERVLRRARGYAPISEPLPKNSRAILAYGAHQKCAVCLAVGNRAVIGQHIGDLETERAVSALEQAARDLPNLHGLTPEVVVCDLHPDYASSRLAGRTGLKILRVQHHYAHVLSCMAENELSSPVLGVIWDGTGLGDDGTIWGGEFLLVDPAGEGGYDRVAHLRTFPLPGGDKSVKEPRRTGLGILYSILGPGLFDATTASPWHDGEDLFEKKELANLAAMLRAGINCPLTSSVGRLFDAAAAFTGLRYHTAYEGQAAMLFEYEARRAAVTESYDFSLVADTALVGKSKWILDWEPAVRSLLSDRDAGRSAGDLARMFHNGLSKAVVEVASRAGVRDVALTGGCFQNKLLTEIVVSDLRAAGFVAHTHRRVPPNDGGIALGQVMAAIHAMEK